MTSAFIDHRPHASSEHVSIFHYVIVSNGVDFSMKFETQMAAKLYACNAGYRPVHVA